MLEPLVDGVIWVSERRVPFSGITLRARTTVVRLEDGGLWVHSPGPVDDATAEALAALGPVRWLVVPNEFHHLEAPANAARYPDARVIAPEGIEAKSPTLTPQLRTTDPALADAIPEIDPRPLDAVPFLDETLFFHRPTGSLIGADAAISACAKDHWDWRLVARIYGCFETPKVPPDVWLFTKRDARTARALEAMLDLPIERLLVAHADPIEDDPKQKLARAWGFVLKGR